MNQQTIRVLHVVPQLGVGGCEKQLLEMVRRFARDRFELTICWYHWMQDELAEQFAEAGARMVFVDKEATPLWRFFGRLRRVMRETQPDIVHTWLYSGNFWGRWAAVTSGVRHMVASDRNEVWRAGLVERVYEKMLAGRTVRLANSRAVARTLADAFGLQMERILVIYNAVTPPPPPPAGVRERVRNDLALSADTRIVLTVGRLVEPKNYPMLIRAAAHVTRQRDDVVFLAAGPGPDKDALRAQVQAAGLTGQVRFLGLREDVSDLLAAADIFCFTSNSEGFPNAVLEAMMAGLPVISTDFPSAAELIVRPEMGIVVPREDDRALAEQILALLDNPERRRRLGEEARQHVCERYSWDRLVRTMETLYTDLVAGKTPRVDL